MTYWGGERTLNKALLDVHDLHVAFKDKGQQVRVLDGVDLTLHEEEVLGITGETGAGKTTLAHAILRVLPLAWEVSGIVRYRNRDLLKLGKEETLSILGAEIALIPQNPLTSLDPMYTIGDQSGEVLLAHTELSLEEIKETVISYLGEVKLPDPKQKFSSYAHQLSRGEAQRVMIAAALLGAPLLLIADEPTIALDVLVQRRVLELFKEIKRKQSMAMMYLTNDIRVIGEFADSVAVMYAGKIVERGPVQEVFRAPLHPYTKGLLGAMIRMGDQQPVETIKGDPPGVQYRPAWCAFAPRCKHAKPICEQKIPQDVEASEGHFVRCHRYLEI